MWKGKVISMEVNKFRSVAEAKVAKFNNKSIDGASVYVDVDKLLDRGASTRFTAFLEEARGKKFTARLDMDNGYFTMYTLEEDTSPVKWLFHVDDLILESEI